jgi:hypothetical protein
MFKMNLVRVQPVCIQVERQLRLEIITAGGEVVGRGGLGYDFACYTQSTSKQVLLVVIICGH